MGQIVELGDLILLHICRIRQGRKARRRVDAAAAIRPLSNHRLVKERGSDGLEDAFISYFVDAAGPDRTQPTKPPAPGAAVDAADDSSASKRFDPRRFWAYARRETIELLRDPIRLAFAFVGPLILMMAFDLQERLPAMPDDLARGLKQPPAHGLHLCALPLFAERNAAKTQI